MDSLLLHLGEVVIVCDNIGNDGLLIRMVNEDILGVQQFCQSQFLFSDVERIVQIVNSIGLGQFVKLNEVGSMLVNDGIESQTISPGGREISDVNIMIASSFHLAPEQQRVLGALCLLVICLLDSDVLDLEAQNYRPDETEGEPRIAVDDVVRAHVLEMDALLAQELQRLVHVLETVNPHLALRGPW